MPSQQNLRAAHRRERRESDHRERGVASVARVSFTRVPPRKARLVADMIRGMQVGEAFRTLKFTHRPSAVPVVERLLKSAVANVERARRSTADALVIGRIWVDGGPMLKRLRPRAMGRGARVRKRLCHISMELMAKDSD